MPDLYIVPGNLGPQVKGLGLDRDYRVYIGGYIGIMEKKMETTVVYWGNIEFI